jgi:hypothetical protein
MYNRCSKNYFFNSSVIVVIILSLLLSSNLFVGLAAALSPSFGLQERTNENRHWIQTYGDNDAHLKSNYTDLLAVSYISNGEILNATIWLASGFENSSIPAYDQPFRKISYGMLIDADTNTKTGYNGADYDLYVEAGEGKLNGYLYQLSSTGIYKLVRSANLTQLTTDPNALRGAISLEFPLVLLNYPSEYNLLFYAAESYKSNEVRQFTNWVSIPPPGLELTTSPSNLQIRQGQELTIPARIRSTSGFSHDVINITLASNDNNNLNYDMLSGFNSSDLHVTIERNQPPLFKIEVPQKTPLGIYTVPLVATIREPSIATLTKPISTNTTRGVVDPEFELSKKYPTVGYLTKPVNFTVTVIEPQTIGEYFKDFWGTYGQFIGIFAGGFVGAYARVLFDRRKKKQEENHQT